MTTHQKNDDFCRSKIADEVHKAILPIHCEAMVCRSNWVYRCTRRMTIFAEAKLQTKSAKPFFQSIAKQLGLLTHQKNDGFCRSEIADEVHKAILPMNLIIRRLSSSMTTKTLLARRLF